MKLSEITDEVMKQKSNETVDNLRRDLAAQHISPSGELMAQHVFSLVTQALTKALLTAPTMEKREEIVPIVRTVLLHLVDVTGVFDDETAKMAN